MPMEVFSVYSWFASTIIKDYIRAFHYMPPLWVLAIIIDNQYTNWGVLQLFILPVISFQV